MSTESTPSSGPPPDFQALVVPCVDLQPGAPLRWLRKGWQDWRRAPGLSLLFGLLIAAVSILVSAVAWWLGRFALLAALLSGFVFIAPLLAVGLYCVSRQLEAGQTPRLADSFSLARRLLGQAGVFALAQFVILLLWSRAGMMVSALVPLRPGDLQALLEFLAVGSAIGSLFAALTFAVSVVSLPMIADREVDMITACLSSLHAVMRNKWTMLLWAVLIAGLTAIGFATAFLGLIVLMPWLAYASWHAYRETLIVDDLPRLG
ncbi:DUF2189 domain-containing protein [Pseudomarimonas arenosa]|uniref:DUF2189 domain-containing protein n=1 Tax=Pseudomarimonas arenosa TaxID=2774145 RepID=A0AAW3ZDA9_9GAMM|nr:DUF2189 domain-containing protein [Pseudomarimonas arenosa]MBD8524310.1 DUF2189 domain-containing protein [Pseudomarimonas arenosa]